CLEPHHNLLRSALTIAQAYCIYESCQASSPTPCAATTTGASSSPIAISTAILASASCVISAPPTNSSSSSPKLRDGPWPLCAEGRDFGATAALWDLARQLDLLRSIDAQAPKRKQGPSVGEYLLLATLNRALAPTSKRQLAAWYRKYHLGPAASAAPGRFAQSALLGSPARSGCCQAGADRRRSHAATGGRMGSGSGSAVLRHHQLRHVPFLGEPREAGAAGTRQEQTHRSTHRGLGPAGFLGFSYSSLLPGLRGQPERRGHLQRGSGRSGRSLPDVPREMREHHPGFR